jgi:hypothetical protein
MFSKFKKKSKFKITDYKFENFQNTIFQNLNFKFEKSLNFEFKNHRILNRYQKVDPTAYFHNCTMEKQLALVHLLLFLSKSRYKT